MKSVIFSLFVFLIFSQTSNSQTIDPETESYLEKNVTNKIQPELQKSINVIYLLDSLKFKTDKIEAFKAEYNKLDMQLKESKKLIISLLHEPKPSHLDEKYINDYLTYVSSKDYQNIYKAKEDAYNLQNNFIYLAEMTGENNIIENEADLDKIMEVYLGFEELSKHYNHLLGNSSEVYSKLKYSLNKETPITCNEINEFSTFCDDFDEKGMTPYTEKLNSLLKRFEQLPEEYQKIDIKPKVSRSDSDQKIIRIDLEYKDSNEYEHYVLYNRFYENFIEDLRTIVSIEKEDKNCK